MSTLSMTAYNGKGDVINAGKAGSLVIVTDPALHVAHLKAQLAAINANGTIAGGDDPSVNISDLDHLIRAEVVRTLPDTTHAYYGCTERAYALQLTTSVNLVIIQGQSITVHNTNPGGSMLGTISIGRVSYNATSNDLHVDTPVQIKAQCSHTFGGRSIL